MADQPKSTAETKPRTWEDQPAFREVFLSMLPPNHAEQCRELGDYFYSAVLEAHMHEGGLREMLLGIAADIHVCADVLRGVHRDHFNESAPGYPHPLELWRDRLLSVESELLAAVDAGLGA